MKSLREIAKKSSLSLDDLVAIEEAILQTGYMTHEKALTEIEHFAVDLGLDDYYFKTTSVEDMVKHLISISASGLVSKYGGVGVGISTVAAPLYISEISPANMRGRLAGMFQFNIVFGILVAFLSIATLWYRNIRKLL